MSMHTATATLRPGDRRAIFILTKSIRIPWVQDGWMRKVRR